MLRSIELENFKAFGKRVHIPLAPITLIFGQNSSGKSSILQSLSLLKQTREGKERNALLLPYVENGLVDLGSFFELVFDHDRDRTVCYRLEADPLPSEQTTDTPLADARTAIELAFHQPPDKNEIKIKYIEIFQGETLCRVARFEPIRSSHLLRCTWFTTEEEIWRAPYNEFTKRRRQVKRALMQHPAFPASLRQNLARQRQLVPLVSAIERLEKLYLEAEKGIQNKLKSETNKGRVRALQEELNKLQPAKHECLEEKRKANKELKALRMGKGRIGQPFARFLGLFEKDSQIGDFIKLMVPFQKGRQIGLSNFVPFSLPRDFRQAEESIGYIVNRIGSQVMLDVGVLVDKASGVLDHVIGCLFPLGPSRRSPERLYFIRGIAAKDVGHQGERLAGLLGQRPELVKTVNRWFAKLDIGYEIVLPEYDSNWVADMIEIRLLDNVRGEEVDVSLSDTGYGINQLLPFIVQSLMAKDQIITIEQPEVHVHPRLQANLGDLIIHSALGKNQNQFLIETHSEHLLLRIMRRMRDTASGRLPKGIPPVLPEDVKVLYVEREKFGSIVREMPLNERGELVKAWPGGFFEEGLREVLA